MQLMLPVAVCVCACCSRSRPVVGLCAADVDDDADAHDVWSLLDPLSVVCCRLQTLVEARGDPGRSSGGTSAGGDVRWQAGLLASIASATQRLQVLAASTTTTSSGSHNNHVESSFTVSSE